MIEERPGLGAVAPARLGRADRRLRRRRRQCAEGRGGQPAHHGRLRDRKAPTPGSPTAPRSASSATTMPSKWQQVTDILDVWFDSGSTHTFTLEDRPDLKWPADVYLEGSDQHRGWFHSSLLESCGTRGRAPYDTVVTHGFTMDEEGRKMSKSLGNTVVPQDVIKQSGADILRLWVVTTDYWEDQRLGKNVLQTNVDAYRKLRNTIRWMLGTLAHDEGETVAARGNAGTGAADAAPAGRARRGRARGLRRLRVQAHHPRADRLHGGRAFGLLFRHPQGRALLRRAVEPAPQGVGRGGAASVRLPGEMAGRRCCPSPWRRPGSTGIPTRNRCICEQFPEIPADWRDEALAEKWRKVRQVRRVVTGALEIERAKKVIGSSLEAAPVVHITDPGSACRAAMASTSPRSRSPARSRSAPLPGAGRGLRARRRQGRGVVPGLASGTKCARSWRFTHDVGSDPQYPDVSARDAAALHELAALGRF